MTTKQDWINFYQNDMNWVIFPVGWQSNNIKTLKIPIVKDWTSLTRENQREKITRWNAPNLGVLTGEINGIIVLDIDNKIPGNEKSKNLSLKNGLDEWKFYIGIHGEPQTFKVKTGSGGYHYYFKYNDAVKDMTSTSETAVNDEGLKMAWDIKNNGGYVVVPPSHNGNGYYDFDKDFCQYGINEMPTWIIELINRQPVNKVPTPPNLVAPRLKPTSIPVPVPRTISAPVLSTNSIPLKTITDAVNAELDKEPPTGEPIYQQLSYDALKDLLETLSIDRAIAHDPRYQVIFALRSEANKYPDNQIYELAHHFCRRSPEEYTVEKVDNIWNQRDTGCANPLTVGSLMRWLQEDIGVEAFRAFKAKHNIGKVKNIGLSLSVIPPMNCYDNYQLYDYERWATDRVFSSKGEAKSQLLKQFARVIRRVSSNDPYYVFKTNSGFTFNKKDAFGIRKKYGFCSYPEEVEEIDRNGKVHKKTIYKSMYIMYPLTEFNFITHRDITWIPYHKDLPLKVDPKTDANLLNIFPGFKAEKVDLTPEALDKIKPMLDHLKIVWANGDINIYKWIMTYLAYPFIMLQRTQKVLVLIGPPGCGKTIIFDGFMGPFIYGEQLSETANGSIEAITQRFNGVIKDKMLYIIGETDAVDNNTNFTGRFQKIKELITGSYLKIEQKGLEVISTPNYCSFVICSNNRFAVHLDDHDRRYCVLYCSDIYRGNKEYFNMLASLFTQEIANIFYSFLRSKEHMEPLLVNINDIPMTSIKADLIEISRPRQDVFHLDVFINGSTPIPSQYIKFNREKRSYILNRDIYELYDIWYKEGYSTSKKKTSKSFFIDFKSSNVLEYTEQKFGAKSERGYFIPDNRFDTINVLINNGLDDDYVITLRSFLENPDQSVKKVVVPTNVQITTRQIATPVSIPSLKIN